MAYPSLDMITSAASSDGVPVFYIYAYAAQYGNIPVSPTAAQQYQASIDALASSLQTQTEYVLGYIQANGFQPDGQAQLRSWMALNRYSTDGSGGVPSPGQSYPPGGAAMVPAISPFPAVTQPGPTQGQADLSAVGQAGSSAVTTAADWVRQNESKLLLGGAILGAFYLRIPQALMRGLRGRY